MRIGSTNGHFSPAVGVFWVQWWTDELESRSSGLNGEEVVASHHHLGNLLAMHVLKLYLGLIRSLDWGPVVCFKQHSQ